RVQQLVPGAIEYTIGGGESPDRQELLPLGVAMEASPRLPSEAERADLRRRLGLPTDRRIVMSAGAVNRQKRIDYLIDEVASLPDARPFLLITGQTEAETPALRRRALERLGSEGHDIRTVAPGAMPDHYRASDAFVLASLWESFGRVLVEAQSHGLPCLAHAHPVMEWVLGEEGDTADRRRQDAARLVARSIKKYRRSHRRYDRRHPEIFNPIEQARMHDELGRALAEVRDGGSPPRALDLGCGTGNVTRHLLELGASVLAADVSPEFLAAITRTFGDTGRVETLQLNGRDLTGLADASIDVVCAYSVLH